MSEYSDAMRTMKWVRHINGSYFLIDDVIEVYPLPCLDCLRAVHRDAPNRRVGRWAEGPHVGVVQPPASTAKVSRALWQALDEAVAWLKTQDALYFATMENYIDTVGFESSMTADPERRAQLDANVAAAWRIYNAGTVDAIRRWCALVSTGTDPATAVDLAQLLD